VPAKLGANINRADRNPKSLFTWPRLAEPHTGDGRVSSEISSAPVAPVNRKSDNTRPPHTTKANDATTRASQPTAQHSNKII
jgi:hypothetical protein